MVHVTHEPPLETILHKKSLFPPVHSYLLIHPSRYMNMVLADCEEFRKVRSKDGENEREEKKILGFVVLRGENVMSFTPEAPPAATSAANKNVMATGPGKAAAAGRGGGAALGGAGGGLQAPLRGVGGPAAAQMQPGRAPGMPR